MITLLIVGDEPIPRSGLRHLLISESDFQVVGEGEERAAAQMTASLKPNVVLFHVPILKYSFAEVISSVRKTRGAGIVIVSREIQAPYLGRVLSAGASAFVLVRSTPGYLFSAIRAAARQQRFIDPHLSDQLLDYFAEKTTATTHALSRRERQVLKMFAQGYTLNEIADFLGVGRRSIETYQIRLRKKLKLRTRAELVRYALETGVLR